MTSSGVPGSVSRRPGRRSRPSPDPRPPCAEPAAVHRHARARPRAGHLAANGHRFAVGVLERRALPRAGRRTRLVPRIDTSSGSPASFAHSSWENAPTRTHRHAANSLQRHRIDGDIIDVHRPSVFCRVTESYERSPPSDRPRLASTMKPKPNVDRGRMRRRSSPASSTIAVRPITTSPSGRSDTRRSTNTERMPGSAECPEAHRLRPD